MDPETLLLCAAGSRFEADRRSSEDAILAHISNRGPVERAQVIENVEGRAKTKLEALAHLVAKGVLRVSGAGRKGDPYCYSLAAEGSLENSVPAIPTAHTERRNGIQSEAGLGKSPFIPFPPSGKVPDDGNGMGNGIPTTLDEPKDAVEW